MNLSFTTLGVFTNTRYEGNPLAIIKVPTTSRPSLTQEQKQRIASEFNLSEVVFLHEPPASSSQAEIDIFTTVAELPFAGHPTIGTASYILHHTSNEKMKSILTKAGPIPISINNTSNVVSAEIPHDVHIHNLTYSHPLVPGANFPVVSIVKGMSFIHIRLPDIETLGKANEGLLTEEESYNSYTALDEGWQTGLIATHFYVPLSMDEEGRQVIRIRAYASMEDPATGSAATSLCAYLSLTAKPAIKQNIRTFKYMLVQGVEMGRRSEISVDVVLNEDGTTVASVVLSGTAVKVMEGTLEV